MIHRANFGRSFDHHFWTIFDGSPQDFPKVSGIWFRLFLGFLFRRLLQDPHGFLAQLMAGRYAVPEFESWC
jgi:hypothetical protein